MKDSSYIIGIDLGTTNSALSYIDTSISWDIHILKIPQYVSNHKINELSILPSFIYINSEDEGIEPLPWGNPNQYLVGELARKKGALIPNRLVASAKSWLRHNKVDRRDKILPFAATENSIKISPVTASSYYLKYLSDVWDYVIANNQKACSASQFKNQQIVITIPASFDETARELTVEAAEMAGIKDFTMLEEPQAAFYSWLKSHANDWGEYCQDGDVIFIIDIDGGTTDFNLITLSHKDGAAPVFQRAAVGEHLLLGGDNMDIALARNIEARLNLKKLPLKEWLALSYQCRSAKEELLMGELPHTPWLDGDDKDAVKTISVLGAGKSIIGSQIKQEVSVKDVKNIILDGFFEQIDPFIDTSAQSQNRRISGLMELGLPYVTEPNVMIHIAAFLKRHAVNQALKQIKDTKSAKTMIRPDAILFNGGVFKSQILRQRTITNMNDWMKGDYSQCNTSLKILENDNLDLAVAIGAAYYGMAQRGTGSGAAHCLSISGGLGLAYYIGVQGGRTDPSLSNDKSVSVVCIIPKGFEEGQELILKSPQFQVMTNNPVSFSLYSSTYRVGDKAGDIITDDLETFSELPKITTILHYGKKDSHLKIPVNIGVRLNEYGTIDVWCQSIQTTHKWKLSFQLRYDTEKIFEQSHIIEESLIDQASMLIEQTFKSETSGISLNNLGNKLTEVLDIDKTLWQISGIRRMWDTLIKLRERRLVTGEHEMRWLNLAGFLLRPGFGASADDWRIKELWKIYREGIKFSGQPQCRLEWWILWRRVAGGLDRVQQEIIYKKIAPFIVSSRRGVSEYKEMLMLAASLEHLSPNIKAQIGDIVLKDIKKSKATSGNYLYWTLSRLGARTPFHGQINKVIAPEVVSGWIMQLLGLSVKDGAYCIASLARKTDDRTRDIDETLRAEIIDIFNENGVDSHLIREVKQSIEAADKKTIFGESLPIGLFIE